MNNDDDDPIDEHTFELNGANLDDTRDRWAYPFSRVSQTWIALDDHGFYYSRTQSRYTLKTMMRLKVSVCAVL